jgi:hypothetical protein
MSLYGVVHGALRSLKNIVRAQVDQGALLAAVRIEQARQAGLLDRILRAVEPLPVARIEFDVVMEGQTLTGVTSMQLRDNEKFAITLAPVDAKGAPSTIDPSKTTFSIDNPALATLTAGADGLSCEVVAGTVGTGQITASVTDANNPNDAVTGTLQLTVVAGDTATLALNTTEPAAQ